MSISSTRDSSRSTSTTTTRPSEPARKAEAPKPTPVATRPTTQAHVPDGFGDSRLGDVMDIARGISLDEKKSANGFDGKSGFDRPKVSHDGVSISGSAKLEGQYETKSGWGISGGVSGKVTGAVSLGTKDGMTTAEVSVEVSATLEGEVKAPVGSLSGSITKGANASYTVSMPEGVAKTVDPTSINPYDPSTMPTGTVVKMESSSFTETELGASFKALSLESGVKKGEGTSLVVEKTGDTTVRVTVGDTKTVDATTRLGVEVAGVGVGIGRTDDLDGGTTSSVELDLATPEGKQAYDALMTKGTLPKEGVTKKEFFSMESSSAIDVKVGDKTLAEFGLGSNSGIFTRTTAPDGTITGNVELQYEGGASLHVEQKFNPDGTERLDERTYTYELTASGETERGELGLALKQPIAEGQKISVTLTEKQMAELHATGKAVGDDYAEASFDPERFAVTLASAPDGALEHLMFRVADPTGTASSLEELKALPMQVIIRP